jgi:spore maturation protein CgeB
MIKFLRISSVYPGFLKIISKSVNKEDTYDELLKKVFNQKYSVSNYLSLELNKIDYECNEIIYNFKKLQNKWIKKNNLNISNDEILYHQIKYYNPDVLFIGDVKLLDKNFVNKIKKICKPKLILCFHCAPLSKKLLSNLKFADAVVTCTKGYKIEIENITKKKTLLMHHAFSEEMKINLDTEREIDVCFIGSLFLSDKLHINRVELIYGLIKNFKNSFIAINFSKYFALEFLVFFIRSMIKIDFIKDLKIFYKIFFIYFFSQKPVFGKNMYSVLRKSKILVNQHIEDTDYAGNMRLFEGTGSGCLMITDHKKELEKLFIIDEEVITYKNSDELFKKIEIYLQNLTELKKIAKKGQEKTMSNHNYSNRINELDYFIKKLYY